MKIRTSSYCVEYLFIKGKEEFFSKCFLFII